MLKLLFISALMVLVIPANPSLAQSGDIEYEIWVRLNADEHRLDARESLRWRNSSSESLDEIYFHLYWNAFKNENSAFLQEGLEEKSFGKREGSLPDAKEAGWIDITSIRVKNGADLMDSMEFVTPDYPNRPGDQTVMKLKLDQPLLPGETISLEMEFTSRVPRTIARSGYYRDSYFIGQWFPKPGVYEEGKGWNCHQYHMHTEFFADYAEFMVHITVPERFVVGASGRLISEIQREQDSTVTYSYWQDQIHDFAWTADPAFIKLEKQFRPDSLISEEEYQRYADIFDLSKEQMKLPPVTMVLLIRKEHAGQAERHFAALEQALKYFGLWFSPYPYETITMVDPPYRTESEGMEYPTLFTAGTSLFISDLGNSPEGVIIHEFGHQFWYGMVGNNEFEEAWLDEGINTYSEERVQDTAYGRAHFIMRMYGWPLSWYFSDIRYNNWELERAICLLAVEDDYLVTPSWRFYNSASYGMNVYYRTATLLNTLERILGEQDMLRVMRAFQTRFRFKHPNSADFIATVNEVGGRDMSWFFDELFYEANNFDYGIGDVFTRRITPSRGVFESDSGKIIVDDEAVAKADTVDRYQILVKVRRLGEARLGGDEKLHVQFTFKDSSVVDKYWDGQDRWHEFRLVSDSKLRQVQVDPENKYLIDSNWSNNSYRVQENVNGARRWANKLMFWLQNFMQVLTIFS